MLADVREYVYTLELARCLGESVQWFRRMLIDVIRQEEERFGPQARLVDNPKQ